MPNARRPFSVRRDGEGLVLEGAASEEPFLEAAYRMTERAYVLVGRRGRKWTASLWAKRPQQDLAARFDAAYAQALASWRRRKDELPPRAEALRLALRRVNEAGHARREPPPRLSPEREREIAAALAEGPVEDPLGIRAFWGKR